MLLKKLTPNKILDVLLIPLIAFIFSLKFQEYFNINLVLIVAMVIYLVREISLETSSYKLQRLNALDYSLLLVVLFELLSFTFSTYPPNSFQWLMEICFLFLFYNLVRFNLKHEYQRVALYIFITLCALCLAYLGILNLIRLQQRLSSLGYTDLTDFRNLIWFLNPVGISIGEWVTVLFVMLPFPVILFIKYRQKLWVRIVTLACVVAIVFTISITFIRGAYIALAAYFVIGTILFYVYKIFPLKKILLFNVVVLGLLVICMLPFARPAITTLSILKTASQSRSLEARRSIWKNSLDIVKQHPILGIGANNFAMQYVAYNDSGSDSAFVIRPFNYFLHILIEKGIVGLVVYLLLLVSFFWVSHRKVKRLKGDVYRASVVICFMTAYATILVRDLSESSILANRGVTILLWFMFANNARLDD